MCERWTDQLQQFRMRKLGGIAPCQIQVYAKQCDQMNRSLPERIALSEQVWINVMPSQNN